MREFRRVLSPVVLAAFVLAIATSCGASAREKTIAIAYTTTNAARDGFIAFDAKIQLDIAAHSGTDKASAQAALAAYRIKADHMIELLDAMYRAIAAAAIINPDPKSMTNLTAAGKILADELAVFLKEKAP